ncbi:MAG TPA: flavin reductase family protein [Rhizobiaceae bacterium]|nr:flavin reductase family protein [Rhizobiaceae bacterium]
MRIDLNDLVPSDQYKLLAGSIVPRPIALVSSRSLAGQDNAAPFSFFGVLGEAPAILAIGVKNNPDGSMKDTSRHVIERGELVVNLVDEDLALAMNLCALDAPPDVSEAELAGLTLVPGEKVGVPRIAEAPFAFECQLVDCLTKVPDRQILLVEVVLMHARDGLVDLATRRIDQQVYRPVGRLTGNDYLRASDRFQLTRPTWT